MVLSIEERVFISEQRLSERTVLEQAFYVMLVFTVSEPNPVCTSSVISSKTHTLLPLAQSVQTATCM
jgi:hypothetical protein